MVEYHGVFYKIGRHGFLYRWSENLGEWVRSSQDPLEVGLRPQRRVIRPPQPRSKYPAMPASFSYRNTDGFGWG